MDPLILRVDGQDVSVASDPATPLLYVLRNELGLTGPKLGCGLEQCGACAVLVDGRSTLSCNVPVGQFSGKTICTVQAKDEPVIAAVKNAFVQAGAAQCGYCIPGMVIAISGLLKRNARPPEHEIRDALQPHLCRCGTHTRILQAARALAAGGSLP